MYTSSSSSPHRPSSHADRTGHDDSHAGVTGGDEDDDDATAFACLDDCLVQRDCRLAANDALVQVVNLPALSVSNHHGGMLPAQQEELLTVRGESVGYRHEFEVGLVVLKIVKCKCDVILAPCYSDQRRVYL